MEVVVAVLHVENLRPRRGLQEGPRQVVHALADKKFAVAAPRHIDVGIDVVVVVAEDVGLRIHRHRGRMLEACRQADGRKTTAGSAEEDDARGAAVVRDLGDDSGEVILQAGLVSVAGKPGQVQAGIQIQAGVAEGELRDGEVLRDGLPRQEWQVYLFGRGPVKDDQEGSPMFDAQRHIERQPVVRNRNDTGAQRRRMYELVEAEEMRVANRSECFPPGSNAVGDVVLETLFHGVEVQDSRYGAMPYAHSCLVCRPSCVLDKWWQIGETELQQSHSLLSLTA